MIDSLLLGVTQGITEFLPVSSSAHLVFLQHLLGWSEPDLWFDILLHIATLCAVLVFFRNDIIALVLNDKKTAALIVIASIPTACIGFFLKDFVEIYFSSVLWPGLFMLVTGTLLFFTRFYKNEGKPLALVSIWEALIIGTVQGIAILPGISRSGSTIAVAIFLGWQKAPAARFSFLLSIPAIAGATLIGLKDFSGGSAVPLSASIVGFIAAFGAGLGALQVLFALLFKNRLSVFAYYCWAVGLFILLLR